MALSLTACVERKLLVRSDPADVAIYVDGRLHGRTDPTTSLLEIPFEWYGTRTIVARKAGFVPTRLNVELDPPWWQVFPIDLFADVLWPGTLVDEHEAAVELERRGEPRPAEAVEAAARHYKSSSERRPR